jgi:hypothetical protein
MYLIHIIIPALELEVGNWKLEIGIEVKMRSCDL